MKENLVIGVDEAGRGCLAGPVVSSAVFLPPDLKEICPSKIFSCITDSKKLSEQKREMVFDWLIKNVLYGVGESSAEVVDKIGIKKANYKAMEMALDQCVAKRDSGSTIGVEDMHLPLGFSKFGNDGMKVLIDGNDGFEFEGFDCRSIIKGDEKELCISAASIIAKVIRDKYMRESAIKFPQYRFETHKGYGTKYHIAAIERHGVCQEHRKSFEPIPKILYQTSLFL